MTAWHLIAAMVCGWIFTLTGAALGGYLVFRTKRDPHDNLFQVRPPQGDAYNSDVVPVIADIETEDDVVPEIFRRQTNEFLRQYSANQAKSKAEENIADAA